MIRTTISPEIELVLQCLRWAAAGPSQSKPLNIAPPEIDRLNWKEIAELGQTHQALGFIAFALEQNGVFPFLKPKIQVPLTRALLEAEWKNREKFNKFKEIRLLFSGKNIPVIPLKGIDLSLRIYSGMPFRQMGDIDLLIRESDLPEASSFLFNQGFRLRTDPPMKNRWHDSFYPKDDTPFQKISCGRKSFEKDSLDLDLHWKPNYQVGGRAISMDQESAWSNAWIDSTLGENALRLSEEDLSWHLILHTAEMSTPTLIQLLDMACLMNRWSAQARAEIEQRVSRLEDSPKNKIEALLGDVRAVFCEADLYSKRDSGADDLISFFIFQKNSDRYPKKQIKTQPLAYESLSPLKQLKFLAGYLFPNPAYYLNKNGKTGLSMYFIHWRDLVKKLGRKSN